MRVESVALLELQRLCYSAPGTGTGPAHEHTISTLKSREAKGKVKGKRRRKNFLGGGA
jgi:hypothetical protein